MAFQHFNCIVVFNKTKDKLLFCKRAKDPYQGLYNFVGGKREKEEGSETAAYRELFEETGIRRKDIKLHRLMDMTYYQQELVLEMYIGMLYSEVELVEEANSLHWIALNENFADTAKYAGDKNIAHIVEVALLYSFKNRAEESPYRKRSDSQCLKEDTMCLGIDGCKGGWITAVIEQQKLRIEKYHNIGEVMTKHGNFDNLLIDMVIGLPGNELQYEQRPDGTARKLIIPRTSTIFPVPSRQAVYEMTEEAQVTANKKALGKGLSKQTMAIIPKMREIDTFLTENPDYKNRIKESHPEVCFARLNGAVVMSKKSTPEGLKERINILSAFLPELTTEFILDKTKEWKCNADDIIDAICLAVTANMDLQGKAEAIPEEIQMDDHGLRMQMVIPKNMIK